MNTLGLSAYIVRHWEPSRLWDKSQLVPWVDWFVDDHRIATVSEGGRVVGLGMCRALKDQEEHTQPYAHDEDGPHAWIDLFISQDKKVGSILWDALLVRLGQRETLGFQRHAKQNRKARFHNFTQMERIMRYGK